MGRLISQIAAITMSVLSLAAWDAEAASSVSTNLAPGVPIRGRIFSNIYLPVSKPVLNPYRQALTSAWVQLDPSVGDSGSGRVILTADAIDSTTVDPSVGSGSVLKMGIREGYGEFSKNGIEVRAGKQIIPWGKSDAINPTDLLTAKDYSLLNSDEEVRRLGATGVRGSWTPLQGNSPLTFLAVWNPIFAQNRLLIPQSALPAGVDLAAWTPTVPKRSLSNSETAFKLSYVGAGWDASALGYRGWNHFPEFTIDSSGNLQRTFHRIHAAGGDVSASFQNWVVRAESAYLWTEYDSKKDPELQPTRLDAVAGVERPIADDFRIQLQGILRYHPEFVKADDVALNKRGVARINQLIVGSQFKTRPGSTFRFSYTSPTSGFEAELFLLGNWIGGDYLVRPKMSYPWNDAFRTTLSVDYYGGPENLALGALQVFNSVSVEAKYTF